MFVLIVEDNEGDLRNTMEALESGPGDWFRFDIDTARTLEDAHKHLGEMTADAVILDLNLPDSQGLATLDAVLGRTKAPVVVLTGQDDRMLSLDAIQRGAQDVRVKGHDRPESLVRAILFSILRADAARMAPEKAEALRRGAAELAGSS